MSRITTNHDRHRPSRQWLGREGETRAAQFLESRGYRIVARNVRANRVEIDLIVRRGSLLVFVEVKSRRKSHHGYAAEAVDPRKQSRLRRGAHAWLAANPLESRRTHSCRFDVVTCLFEPHHDRNPIAEIENETPTPESAGWSMRHWEAAF